MATRHIKFWKYYKEWIELYKKGHVRNVTYNKYSLIMRYFKENYPDIYLDEITRMQLQGIINKYGETHEFKTVKDFIDHIRAPFQDALYEGYIKKDPAYKLAPTSKIGIRPKHKYIESLDEVEELVRVLKTKDNPLATMFDFDLRTGLRFAELLGLTKKDIDFKNMTIYVNKSWQYKKAEGGFGPTKNKYSTRMLKIDWQSLQDLYKASSNCDDESPIFVENYSRWKKQNPSIGRKSSRIYNSTINKVLKRYCEEADIEPITVHGLRHTHASILIASGISIQSVAKRLGHGNTDTTQEVYIHLLDDLANKDDSKIMSVLSRIEN